MLRKQNTKSIKHFSSCVNLWMYPIRLTVRRKYSIYNYITNNKQRLETP